MKLLRIDASSRINGSDSRNMANQFQQQWQTTHPNGEVFVRDIISTGIPHISQQTIEGFYTPKENFTSPLREVTQLSDQLIAELKEVNVLLISTPMYNFGIPSALKAWIDHIVRINNTFGVHQDGAFYGMVEHVKAYIITSAGAVYTSNEMKALDFLTPYLQSVLGLIEITDITFLPLQGTTMDVNTYEKTKMKVLKTIQSI
ncbi:FMN-dependent NADH-azoreductase [Aquimarina sp. AU474]|uniref:FMN-dependent NADH-azoreductase n=1 Tax=Aquimarina sp. AU474 TaxID=2108529 RepID=UPI000D693DF2|nr:NAD(P)H-dependent oxidoreductase [Aquimarina sp. AU474]